MCVFTFFLLVNWVFVTGGIQHWVSQLGFQSFNVRVNGSFHSIRLHIYSLVSTINTNDPSNNINLRLSEFKSSVLAVI